MNEHHYTSLYEAALSLIPQESKVVELGCGNGRFAQMVLSKCKTYTGFDINKEVISGLSDFNYPEAVFVEADVTKLWWEEQGLTFVALEVFEHLAQDLAVIQKFPIGSRVVFSVPSFDSSDHKRFFPIDGEPLRYYSNILDLDLWRKIRIPTGGGFFHLMRGYR